MKMKKKKDDFDDLKSMSDNLKDAGVKVRTIAHLLGNQQSYDVPLSKGDYDYGLELILAEIGEDVEEMGRQMELEEIKTAQKRLGKKR